MSVLLYCPECDEIFEDEQETMHIKDIYGDGAVLTCSNCGWVGNVYVEAKFEKIEVKEDQN